MAGGRAIGRAGIAAAMSEKVLDRHVRTLLHDLGLWEFSFHAPDGVKDPDGGGRPRNGRYQAGFPDWFIVGPCGMLWRELKTAKGKLTPKQVAFLERIRVAGGDADVWRPDDLTSGRIVRELRAIADPRFHVKPGETRTPSSSARLSA
jgi:hypothetical protein